jgi:hypothetical protein
VLISLSLSLEKNRGEEKWSHKTAHLSTYRTEEEHFVDRNVAYDEHIVVGVCSSDLIELLFA